MAAPTAKPCDYDAGYLDYQLRRNWLRRFIRGFYLRHIRRLATGPCLDFGCGTGDLLRHLPPGSLGLEVNPATVAFGQTAGLPVLQYDPDQDRYALAGLTPGRFACLILSHVLEHLSPADRILATLAASAGRLGMQRLILVVPGAKGFAHDPTHQEFIDLHYLRTRHLLDLPPFRLTRHHWFPLNAERAGRIFTHNELVLIFYRL